MTDQSRTSSLNPRTLFHGYTASNQHVVINNDRGPIPYKRYER